MEAGKKSASDTGRDESLLFRAVLVYGLGISFLSMTIGLVLAAFNPGAPIVPLSLSDLITGLDQLQPSAWLNLGVFLLLATPMARVAVSAVVFVLVRDNLYCALTTAVFLILLVSFRLGVH